MEVFTSGEFGKKDQHYAQVNPIAKLLDDYLCPHT